MTSARASTELAEAVKRRGRIVIDPDRLAAHAVEVLDARLAKAVDERFSELESRVAVLGTAQTEKASESVGRAVDAAHDVERAVGSAERRVEKLSARVTWVVAGRMGLALIPLAVVLLVLGGLTTGAFHALGIGPLLGWAWGSFAQADLWWQKALIALGALSGATGFGWLVWAGGLWLTDKYRGW